jgi:cell division septal protein FtsQ
MKLFRRRRKRRSQTRLKRYQTEVPLARISLTPVLNLGRRQWSKLLSSLLLGSLIAAVYIIFSLEPFYVYEATISGVGMLTPQEVYAASGIDSMSIFWIDPERVAGRLAQLPEVRQARVTLSLPNRVLISVEEQRPLALWQSGEQLLWLSAEGVLLPVHGELGGALRIVDADRQTYQPGDQVDPGLLTAALGLRELMPKLAVVQLSRSWGISFRAPEGWRVYLGDGEDMEAKLAILRALQRDIAASGEQVKTIDLRFTERPYYY